MLQRRAAHLLPAAVPVAQEDDGGELPVAHELLAGGEVPQEGVPAPRKAWAGERKSRNFREMFEVS